MILLGSAGMIFGQQQPFWQPEVGAHSGRKAHANAQPVPRGYPRGGPVPTPQLPATGLVSEPGMDEAVSNLRLPPVSTPGPEPGYTPYRPQGRVLVAPGKPAPAQRQSRLPQAFARGRERRNSPESLRIGHRRCGRRRGTQRRKQHLFSKMYDYAIMEYEKFLVAHPSATGRDIALFRLAECHRMLGNEQAARSRATRDFCRSSVRANLPARAPTGSVNISTPTRNTIRALIQFQLAAKEAANDEVRISAKYNIARCLDRLKRPEEAAKFYEEVAAVQKNNPYLYYARLSLAENAAAVGRRKEALENFAGNRQRLGPSAVRAEAAVKAASLACRARR